jgi:hypothetical protein
MNIGYFLVEQEIADKAVERAMAAHRARKAREQRRVTSRGNTGLGRGARRISREEAIAKIAKTHPRSALKLLNQHFGGRTVRGR